MHPDLRGPPELDDEIDSMQITCATGAPVPAPDCNTCYVDIWEDDRYGGPHDRLCGPLKWSSMRGLPGARKFDWGDKVDSLKVGSRARLTVWADEGFDDTRATFGPGDERPGLGDMGDEIDSIQITCE